MVCPDGWVFALLVVIVFILMWVKWHRPHPAAPRARPNAQPTPHPLKPRTPADCPACRITPRPGLAPASPPPKPYSQVKSPRGRRKRIATAGFACPNPECRYFGITDDQIHALVGYGGHGRQEYIRDLKCQACRTCAGYLPHPRRVGTQTGYIPLLGAAYYVVLRGCTTTTRGEGWRGCNV